MKPSQRNSLCSYHDLILAVTLSINTLHIFTKKNYMNNPKICTHGGDRSLATLTFKVVTYKKFNFQSLAFKIFYIFFSRHIFFF